jgi:micrococcal nuclease
MLALAGCGGSGAAAGGGDRDCGDFRDQAAAQARLDADSSDPDGLDSDGNGVACESLLAGEPRADVASGPRRARVLSVVDGDTIKVRAVDGTRETVRLVGIDTPESKRPETPVECGARRAAAALRGLLAGREVTLVRDPTQDARDR